MKTIRDTIPAHILYVENDHASARLFQKRLQQAGYVVDLAHNAEDGLRKYTQASYDVVAVEQDLPTCNGLDLIRQMSLEGVLPPTVLVTGYGGEKDAVDAIKMGASDFIVKDDSGRYLDLLPTVIDQVLQKRYLVEEKQRVIQTLHKRNHDLALLNQLGQELTTMLNVQQVAGHLLRAGTEIIGAEGSSLWLWDDQEEGWLICKAVSHYGEHHSLVDVRLGPGQGIASWVAEHGEEVNISAAPEDERFFPEIDRRMGFQTRNILALPLRARGAVIGVLEIVNKTNAAGFAEEDQAMAEMLAASAAIAIDNARLFSKVQHLAITDELTGIHNRHYFFYAAEREFARAHRYQSDLSAIMLDIDRFKNVNDMYGHATGDAVLREVVARFNQGLRKVDILGRIGGEEFAVVLPQTNQEAAVIVAERLREHISLSPIFTSQGNLYVTVCGGVASLGETTKDFRSLLDCADNALLAAKRSGRNCVRVETICR